MAFWPKEYEDKLRELWTEGWTGTEIAQEINENIGLMPGSKRRGPRSLNRDMVIAKARRMGLPSRPSPLGARPLQDAE